MTGGPAFGRLLPAVCVLLAACASAGAEGFAPLAFTGREAEIAFATARVLAEECVPRDAGTIRGRIAANRILDAASTAGMDVRRDVFLANTPKGEKSLVNLYAESAAGATNEPWVVVLSHFDTKPGSGCPGANDGASTSGLLVGLANAVSCWKAPRGNLLLVWTDGEECMESYGPGDGLWGSRRAVEYVRSRGWRIRAAICVDMIGDRDLAISIPANGTSSLAKTVREAAVRAGYPDLVKEISEFVRDDHVPFLENGYPAIDLIDFSYGPGNAYWHTAQDAMDKISRESLLKSGRLLAEILNALL